MNTNILAMETVALDDSERALVIIDQTKLPNCAEYLHLKTQGEIWTAIRELQVRGAPAIGDAAAIGIYLAALEIGTSGVAILAKHYSIPFYVCAPSSTIDLATPTGSDIQIEQRPPEEVTDMWYKERMAPEGIDVYNPAFDVTDHELITAIITEDGVITDFAHGCTRKP